MSINSTQAVELISFFNACFEKSHHTILKGGFTEPEYLPIQNGQVAEIRFKEDFANSALHEVAHWCIAGKERCKQTDYGYWYCPDGRNQKEQEAFYLVEVKPQSIEWIFSLAIGLEFHISADNLDGDQAGLEAFSKNVFQQTKDYLNTSMPPKAETFFTELFYKHHHKKPEYSDRQKYLNTLQPQ